jgi:branched-chain amino acid transport system substrate-binding protein
MKISFKGLLTGALLAATIPGLAFAQGIVKIGQIEAQTGPNAIYGFMSSQGVPIAVDEINKGGGFKVGDTIYKLELDALDTRGDPKEATIDLKRLLEQDKVKFVFGPFLSNVFVTIYPYAKQFNGKFLMLGGGTRIHEYVGQPGNEFLIRTWNWDAGPKGFGERMVDYRQDGAPQESGDAVPE